MLALWLLLHQGGLMQTKKTLLRSAVVLYFVIAFEVLIMISPFAGFFYSVFNPVLLKLSAHPSTRWLSAFYLPHMVLPQDGFLQFVTCHGLGPVRPGPGRIFGLRGSDLHGQVPEKGAVLGGLYSHISGIRSILPSVQRGSASRSSGPGS